MRYQSYCIRHIGIRLRTRRNDGTFLDRVADQLIDRSHPAVRPGLQFNAWTRSMASLLTRVPRFGHSASPFWAGSLNISLKFQVTTRDPRSVASTLEFCLDRHPEYASPSLKPQCPSRAASRQCRDDITTGNALARPEALSAAPLAADSEMPFTRVDSRIASKSIALIANPA
ncbi:hypothetical protein BDW74DRAFT_3493 [Aspergillus multicolor]|uniref:uncharacterized protein n=1 Tax=Aspergillus multicolor TaxID=41759 RepID=UPI003CCE42B0